MPHDIKRDLYPMLSSLEENLLIMRNSSSQADVFKRIAGILKDMFDMSIHYGRSILADVSNTLYLFMDQAVSKNASVSDIEDILSLSLEYFYLAADDISSYQHVEEADMIKRTVYGFLSRLDGVEYGAAKTSSDISA